MESGRMFSGRSAADRQSARYRAAFLVILAVCFLPSGVSADLLHNSQQFACSLPGYVTEADCLAAGGTWDLSRKWPGGWGIAGQQYGRISCATCHARGSGNIKRIRPTITAASGVFPGSTVSAQRAVPGVSSDFGDDAEGHASSEKICEICHSRTLYHRFDTSDQIAAGGSLHHFNNQDCTSCHPHRTGFRAKCQDCHGYPPVTATPGGPDGLVDIPAPTGSVSVGAHAVHVQTMGYPCGGCHANSVGVGASHNDGGQQSISIGFSFFDNTYRGGTYNGQVGVAYDSSQADTTVTSGGTKTCANVYCHGNYPGSGKNASPAWDSPATAVCGTCHGASRGALPASGSHSMHAGGYQILCTACHKGIISGSDPYTVADQVRHVNGKVDWAFDATDSRLQGGSERYNIVSGLTQPSNGTTPRAYSTCENLYCHSNVQPNGGIGKPDSYAIPKWGSPGLTCSSCHKGGVHGDSGPLIDSGSHTAHLAYTFVSDNLSECAICHSFVPDTANPGCTGCHDIRNPGGNLADVHARHVDGKIMLEFATKFGSSIVYSGTPQPGDGYGDCANTYCHSDGTSVAAGTILANTSATWGTGTLACDACHGYPPAYASGSPKANTHAVHQYTCDTCHSVTTDGTSIINSTYHVNQAYDVAAGSGVSFTYTYAADGGSCSNISCHGNSSARWGEGGACLGCHSVVQGSRAAITDQFSANSHHVQGTAVTNGHCYQCHWEANLNGTINPDHHGRNATAAVDLVVYGAGSRPLSYIEGTTAVRYTANGTHTEIAKIDRHCLGCHGTANNLTVPFGDGKTPKQYAWDGTSIDSRFSQTAAVPWGKYSGANITPKAPRQKAYSAHGNAVANQGGWDLGETWPDRRAGTTNVACFDCHNSHGSTAAGRTVSYAASGGGILKTTTAGIGGYTVNYTPQPGGTAANKNERNPGASLCFDCHLTANGGATTPWGYQGTFGATQQILGYFDTAHFGPGNSGAQQRLTYRQNISFKGGHFGAYTPLKSTATGSIDRLCTPCHDPHGVSTTLNQAFSVPLLKGTWMTSPYREDMPPADNTTYTHRNVGVPYHIDQNTFGASIYTLVTGITQSETEFAGLCLQCHPKERLTDGVTHTWKSKDRVHEAVKGWKTASATVKHRYSCSKCHAPHVNSGLPRLMVTNCLDAPHKGRIGGGIPNISGSEGRIPGSYYQYDPEEDGRIACHEGPNGNAGYGTDQSWNTVTPWYVEDPLVITIGPTTSLSPLYARATITWTTNLVSSSYVDYGLTTAYGSSVGNTQLYTSHTIQLTGLANHSTYHYRVRSTSNGGNTVVSTDRSFYISVPPSVPTTIAEPDKGCPDSCTVTLAWYPSSDVDGGPIEYELEIDDDATFASPDFSSGWIAGTVSGSTRTAVVGPLATGMTWNWRMRSRDANYPSVTSAWSAAKSFRTMTSYPPPGVPTFGSSPTSVTCAEGCSFTLTWSASVNDPDNGPVEYFVEVDDDAAFGSPNVFPAGWLSTTSFLASPLATETTWNCRVQARYADHPEAVSAWSATKSVPILYPLPSVPTLIPAPASTVCAGNCSVPLAWNAATAYNNEVVEYYVEVDDDAAFAAPVVMNSGWTAATSWDATPLDTSKTWYWRVKARDSAHPTAVSAWSGTGTFRTMTIAPPAAPGISLHGNYDSGCADTVVTVWWQPVTSSDGDPVEYYVQADGIGNSGWLSGTMNSWSFTLPAGWGVTWKVMARDSVHIDAISPWSASEYFYDIGSQCWTSSCPLVFGWTGSRFDYFTDIAGPIIGLNPAASSREVTLFQAEVAILNGLQPDAGGKYRVKIRESLPEVTYLDTAKLLAVDAPAGYEVHTSGVETTYIYGYANPLRFYTVKDPLPPVSAYDSHGNDVLPAMLAIDNIPAPLAVFDNDFHYTVDFGTISQPQYAKLLIDGWTLYGVKRLTASQLIQPFIEVMDRNGSWVKVKTIGTPAGDLKTMVVDLGGLFLSDDHRIRIHTGTRRSSRWLIDRVRLDQSVPVEVTVREVLPEAADLQFGGNAITTMSELDTRIIAGDVSLPVEGASGFGNFTRYGDVVNLLTDKDNMYAIMRQGDKVDLTFPAPGGPQDGLARTFVIQSDLFYKSLVVSDQVEPLPFHGMSSYPYPETESYPTDAEHQQYRELYNTRRYGPPPVP